MGLVKVFVEELAQDWKALENYYFSGFSSFMFGLNFKMFPDEFQSQIVNLQYNENLQLNFVVIYSWNYINFIHVLMILQCWVIMKINGVRI